MAKISSIYNSGQILFKIGGRKGRKRADIESEIQKRKNREIYKRKKKETQKFDQQLDIRLTKASKKRYRKRLKAMNKHKINVKEIPKAVKDSFDELYVDKKQQKDIDAFAKYKKKTKKSIVDKLYENYKWKQYCKKNNIEYSEL